ncbi:MAG: PilZ domain-containing protein [Phycisphaerae bacterium]|nr:PilZ domain-containing protein [Phycisphaerae bacterium]
MESERRVFPRAKVSITAQLVHDGGEEACTVTNVSMNGLFVEVEKLERFPAETMLKMHICIDSPRGARSINFEAQVMRIVDGGMGVQIKNMPAESFRQWRYMVMSAMQKQDTLDLEEPRFTVQGHNETK